MSVAGDKDIFGKADALLRRRATSDSDTGAFPVLTDIVDEEQEEEKVEAAAPAETAEEPQAEEPPAEDLTPIETAAVPPDLAQEIVTRVMAEVEGRLVADLESRLTQHLVPQVHAAVASAIGDLRQEIANAIGDAVAEALAQRNGK